jgi:hypothetical protein
LLAGNSFQTIGELFDMGQAISIEICIKDIVHILEELVSLFGGEQEFRRRLNKQHRFYPIFFFYFLNRDKNWEQIDIPPTVFSQFDAVTHLYFLRHALEDARRRTSIMSFFKNDYIDTLCAEAQILSDYARRGFLVRWSSLFVTYPPDFSVTHPKIGLEVDFELKVKCGRGTVETMFDSVSRGLQSLKRRRVPAERPGVIVVHNPDDLGWEKWLNDRDVQERLTSRLHNSEYSIVSGIIFSGGDNIVPRDGGGQCYTRYVSFTSLVAKHRLPEGFLSSSVEI